MIARALLVVLAAAGAAIIWGEAADASTGSCTDTVAASANLTCDLDAGGAPKVAVVVEAACTGGVVPTVNAYRLLDSGSLPEPTSNPLPLTTAQTGDRVCTSGWAGAIRSYEAYGWRKYRVQARNNDTVARTVTITWAAERPVVRIDPAAESSVNVVSMPAVDLSPGQTVGLAGQPIEVSCGDGTCSGGAGGTGLTAEDRERLDLSWWSGAFLCGLVLVLIAVPSWNGAWRFGRE